MLAEQGVGDAAGFKMVSAARLLTAVLSDFELARRAQLAQLAEIFRTEQRNQVNDAGTAPMAEDLKRLKPQEVCTPTRSIQCTGAVNENRRRESRSKEHCS